MDVIKPAMWCPGLNMGHPSAWGVVQSWPFWEGSGATLMDVSDNRNHGAMVALDPATDWVASDVGWGIDFAESFEKIEVDARGLPTGVNDPWTIITTFRLRSYVALAAIFGFGYQLPSEGGGGDVGTGRFLIQFNSNYYFWGGNEDWDTGVSIDADGLLHTVAITSDGVSLRFYRDGVLAAGPRSLADFLPDLNPSGTFITCGSNHQNGDTMDGTVYNGNIYNRALLAREIAQLSSDPWAPIRYADDLPLWVAATSVEAGGAEADLDATGAGSFSITRTASYARAPAVTGTGVVSITREAAYARSPEVTGAGSVSITRIATYDRAFTVTGIGTVAFHVGDYKATPNFTGVGSFSIDRVAAYSRAFGVTGAGSTSFTRVAAYSRASIVTGIGSFDVARSAAYDRSFGVTGAGSAFFKGSQPKPFSVYSYMQAEPLPQIPQNLSPEIDRYIRALHDYLLRRDIIRSDENIAKTVEQYIISNNTLTGVLDGENVGGEKEVFLKLLGKKLLFRTLEEGDNVTITQGDDTLVIASSGGGGTGFDKELSYWANITQDGTLAISLDDWRGRVITASLIWVAGFTTADSRDERWQGWEPVFCGGSGDTNATDGDALIGRWDVGTGAADVVCVDGTGNLELRSNGMGEFNFPLQVRVHIWADAVKTSADSTL